MENINNELSIVKLDHSFKSLIMLAKVLDEPIDVTDKRIAAPINDIFTIIEQDPYALGILEKLELNESKVVVIPSDNLIPWLENFLLENYWLADIKRLQRLFNHVQNNDIGRLGCRFTTLYVTSITAYEQSPLFYRFVAAFLLVLQDVLLAIQGFFSTLFTLAAHPSAPASPTSVGLWQPTKNAPEETLHPQSPIVSATPL